MVAVATAAVRLKTGSTSLPGAARGGMEGRGVRRAAVTADNNVDEVKAAEKTLGGSEGE